MTTTDGRSRSLMFPRFPARLPHYGGHGQFLSAFSGISPHFRPGRHRLSAEEYRRETTDRFTTWNQITGTVTAARNGSGTGPTDQTMLITPNKPNKLTMPSKQDTIIGKALSHTGITTRNHDHASHAHQNWVRRSRMRGPYL